MIKAWLSIGAHMIEKPQSVIPWESLSISDFGFNTPWAPVLLVLKYSFILHKLLHIMSLHLLCLSVDLSQDWWMEAFYVFMSVCSGHVNVKITFLRKSAAKLFCKIIA